MGTSEPLRRDGGVWSRDPRKVLKANRKGVVLEYCVKTDCNLVRIQGLEYWCETSIVEAVKRGYECHQSYCPAHNKFLPTS